ncbi:carboxylesterase 5A [Xenopus laevis]|uniref:Carboxylic ester hydrolase n=1 Tax=Xenopus laevis TaxID=8355 RepID=A0A8J0UW04_XENLA|nr:carboxylesterase 5A [Xenopus laevis]
MESLIKVLLLCCATLGIYGTEDARPLLTTNFGQLLGKTVGAKETDRLIHVFMGVPFAKPPIGPLRFQHPQPPEPWSSVREATENPPMCLQDIKGMELLADFFKAKLDFPPVSEDCLYLNVFTPADRGENPELPVMVFIHGGGLTMGGAGMFEGSALSAYENVVVVSIQYRLGIMGFFSTGDKEARGNYGFLDQVAALRWVRDNIKDFGGDPQSVTIFGESAGALSVSAQVLSPLSKGLFHRAISESGVAILPGLMANKTEKILPILHLVANISSCNVSSMADCLKKKTEDEIVAISAAMKFVGFPVVVDGVFLPKPAEEILASKESNPVPFLIGVNNHEFGWILPLALNISGYREGMEKKDIQSILVALPYLHSFKSVVPFIMEEYFGDTNDPKELRNNFLDLIGDIIFVIPALRTAKYHRDSGHPVYFYEFQHRPSMFDDTKDDFVKADHGDELFFVVGGPFLKSGIIFKSNGTEEEKILSKTIMKYWANFARNGDPNGLGLAEWPKYDEDEDYLEINLTQESSQRLKEGRFKFWTVTLPDKIKEMMEEKEHAEQ